MDPGLTLVGTAGHRAVTVFAFLPVLSADFVAFDDPENFLKSIAPRFGHAQPMPVGLPLAEQGDLHGAIAHYQRALELDPDLPDAQSALADALERVKTIR